MQGFNMGRYVPPDQEGVISGNQLHGSRANKTTSSGVPVVRFEMPFAVWCDGCEQQQATQQPVLIGQGVRFNAEKHRTGAYYSTPIWTFRMRHSACGTWLAIRTDPATTSYLVVEGGRRRRQYDDEDNGDENRDPDARARAEAAALTGLDLLVPTPAEAAADRLSAFDRLERTIAHRAAAAASATATASAAARLRDLAADSARRWQDPYARNRALRDTFRAGRHARADADAADADLRTRLGGLDDGLKLLPAEPDDARRAALVDFGGAGDDAASDPQRTLARPLFAPVPPATTTTTAGSSESGRGPGRRLAPSSPSTPSSLPTYAPGTDAAKRQRRVRDHLASTVAVNTRLQTDPFLQAWHQQPHGTRPKKTDEHPASTRLPGLKRKRSLENVPDPPIKTDDHDDDSPAKPLSKSAVALVSYDSD